MGSSRLPGKALAEIAGKPALAHVLERASQIEGLDEVVLAVPADPTDDPLEPIGTAAGVRVIRGDRDDVLNRYHAAVAATGADVVVRITADCPLLDSGVSSRVLSEFLRTGADYASNVHPRTYPDGYDTEVVSARALDIAWREAVDPFEREHVLPFIWRRPDRFRIVNVAGPVDRASWRLTLDTPDDLVRLRAICSRFPADAVFGVEEVAALIQREPELLAAQA